MGAFRYIKNSFRESYAQRSPEYRARLRKWRGGPSIARVERPTNPFRARELGFHATREFVIARVRVPRGKRRRNKPDQGRKPAKNRKFENPGKPWQWFAEQRALRRFPNLELVNSYWVGEDGTAAYYEVILRNAWSSKPKLRK
jgi:large subunit ribosomal protein L15e